MKIPKNEVGVPLVDAVETATSRRPHLSTVFRWCQRPNRHGIRLESWLIGGRRVTSVEAVRRYIERSTAAADAELGIPVATSAQRNRAHAAAVAELDCELGTD